MAKIRVYELARELSIKNKELIEKLNDMSIPVGSHMSTLDEAAVARIKESLFGKKKGAVEETRVKQTVIRRRKKVTKKESPPVETVAETAIPDQEKTPVQPLEEPQKKKAPSKAKKPRKKTEPAKAGKKKESPVQIVEKDAAQKEDASEPIPEQIKTPEKSKPLKLKKPTGIERAKPEKSKKKRKKEAPAKIIKLAIVPEPGEKISKKKTAPEREKISGKKAKAPAKVLPLPEKAAPPKKAKYKKGRKQEAELVDTDKKFFKKKISFRKKAVIEGEALYSRDAKVRKGRKGRKGVRGKAAAKVQKPQITIPKAIKRRVKIDDTIVLSDLAKRIGTKTSDMIAKLMSSGAMVTANQTIDFDTAALVAAEFDFELERAAFEEDTILTNEKETPEDLVQRPPVVTIMGHVDHGKTSLLDVIRETNVTDSESGGITQRIGAYNVNLDSGQLVFLDTPGHEAFTAMRSRGASITDIVVLVVAADDGAMPQTIEAVNHSRAAEVPLIVAINKIDKANADVERVQRELSELGLIPEAWGGDTIFVEVSAKNKQGIDELLEMILLQAEVLELKANPLTLAQGHVVEAKLDSGRGAVATVLVQKGTLHGGDAIVCGLHYGKVRAMLDDRGNNVAEAGPSLPVEVIGLSGVPNAGDELIALADEKSAKQVSMHRIQKQRAKDLAQTSRLSLEGLFERMQENVVKDLNLIIKADVDGATEALSDSLTKLSNDDVNIHIIHKGTGAVTGTDVSLATVSDAIIIGFSVRPSSKVQALANEENVDIRYYDVIYDVINEIKNAIVGMMPSTFKEEVMGSAEVREVFHVPKIGSIAGCYVVEGKVGRGQKVRLIRDGVVCYTGKIDSLRRFKDDVREVQNGYECGIGIENYNDIKQGDIIECYIVEEIKPALE